MAATKLPKILNLGMGNLGGYTSFYARNVTRNGDWATVGQIVGEIGDNAEILITPYKEFNNPAYIQQMKDHILAINPTVVFVNDKENGASVTAKQVIEMASKSFKLMDFEVDMINKNPQKLHELYLAVKSDKSASLPRNYDYESNNSLYPFIQVWSALHKIVHA